MSQEEEKFFQVSSTLDKYQRINQDKEPINPYEIRIKSSKDTKFYVGYAMYLLDRANSESVTIKATGNAIPKAVNVVEILKRRVEGLHQLNRIKHAEVEDKYEPLEEGLDTVIVKRFLSLIEITLTKNIPETAQEEIGYQKPLPKDEIQKSQNRAEKKTKEKVKEMLEGDDKNKKKDRKRHNNKGPSDRYNKDNRKVSYNEDRPNKNHTRQRIMNNNDNKNVNNSEFRGRNRDDKRDGGDRPYKPRYRENRDDDRRRDNNRGTNNYRGGNRQRIQHKDSYRRASSFDRPRSNEVKRRYDNKDGNKDGARPRIQRNNHYNRDDNRKVHGAIKKRYDNKPQ